MKILLLIVLIGSIYWSKPALAERGPSGPVAADSAEYKIYSALIEQQYGRTIHRPVVIDASTIGGADRFVFDDSFRKMLAISLSPLSQECISSYESIMARSSLLDPAFDTTVPCRLVSQAALATIFRQCPGGWDLLSARFPGCRGYITLSNVGRDASGGEAIVYTEDHCGVLCGEGTFVYLRRGDEGWRVEKKLTVWVE